MFRNKQSSKKKRKKDITKSKRWSFASYGLISLFLRPLIFIGSQITRVFSITWSFFRNIDITLSIKIIKNRKKISKTYVIFPFTRINLAVFGIFLIILPFALSRNTDFFQKKETATNTQYLPELREDYGPIKIDERFLQGKESMQPPLRVVIPSLQINIPVVEAKIINGYWELSQTTASHGIGSANPGEIGNTVIFAHARKGLFLPLKDIKKNSDIYILTKDRWYRYTVSQINEVLPQNTEVIKPTEEETLTLFTCTGFMDSKRLIVIGNPSHP